MDSNVLTVILGLAVNGLTSLIAKIGHKSSELLIGIEFLEKWELEKTSLQPILQRAISEVEESIKWPGSKREEELVCLFLLSPEVEEIVRQIYSTKLLSKKGQYSFKSIKKVFFTSLVLFLASYPPFIKHDEAEFENLTQLLFDAVIKGCDFVLNNAVDQGILAAHEAKSNFRHGILLDEIATIQKKLNFLTDLYKPNIQSILAFEKKYRQQVANRYRFITPPYLDTAKKLSFSKLYVSPHFILIGEKREKPKLLPMTDFLSGVYRAVILGSPGAGKSTFSLKLCHDFATQYTARFFAGRSHITPILVILREYGVEKKNRSCSILQFIELKANAIYQVQPPPSAFEYLLLNGRAVVIFDGLDELIDTSYRQEISNDIESFCNLYPSVPVLVTSREVGYEQAPLGGKRFQVFHIAPFNGSQVEEYVRKWFNATLMDLSYDQREKKAVKFLEESNIVQDLCSNPLMLALICNIYRGENYIPRNRPEVFEKCAIMLFERWDQSRGIHSDLPFDWHIRPIMEYLAHWIYVDARLQDGVMEHELITKTKEYLHEWLFDDSYRAEKVSQEFVAFCTGRAWVFTDVGTKKEGEKIFQFTHTTFLEYFTASYLVRTHRTPADLINSLRPKIERQEWDVVCQLAFQLQSRKIEGAADELMEALIEQIYDVGNKEQWNLLYFAVRCLEFIVPRPRVTRKIAKICIECFLRWGIRWVNKDGEPKRTFKYSMRDIPDNIFNALSQASIENITIINEYLKTEIIRIINSGNDLEAYLILLISEYFDFQFENYNYDDEIVSYMKSLYPKFFSICREAVIMEGLSVAHLIKWYGVQSLFREYQVVMGSIMGADEICGVYLNVILDGPYDSDAWWGEHLIKNLKEIGQILINYPLPWIRIPQTNIDVSELDSLSDREMRCRHKKAQRILELDADALFGAFVLFAILIEARESTPENLQLIINLIETSKLPFFKSLRWVFCARYERLEMEKIQIELDKCGFTHQQNDFIKQWIRQEMNLVEFKNMRKNNKAKNL